MSVYIPRVQFIYFLPCAQGCRGDWDSGVPELSLFLFLFFFENVRRWMN